MDSILIPWVIATTILLFVAAYWIYTLEKRLRAFGTRYEGLMKVADALSATPDHAMLLPVVQRLDSQESRLGRVEAQVRRTEEALPRAVQGLGVVRYSAFEGVGGDQSFSVAMVDSTGHGVVITGIHTGSDVRVFGKPVENWTSSYSLSADEQRALGEARRRMMGGEAPAPSKGSGARPAA